MKIKIEGCTSNSKEFYGTLVITCDCHKTFSVWYEKNRETGNETRITCPYCQREIEVNKDE